MAESIRWRDWGAEAFAEAEEAQAPVLLSLVTAWSEECRAMDRTTFSDPDVVAMISSHFVAVRVDADRHPDINERYNLGGWPTSAFLTADADLLTGGTFLDVQQMMAMARQVCDVWRERAAEIRARGGQQRLARAPASDGRGEADLTAVAHVRSLMLQHFDPVNGGFTALPKVPHAPALRLALSLLAETARASDRELEVVVETTLDRISRLWDSGGGGFFRYADAGDWGSPAAEKTLEDNAALLHLYIDAATLSAEDAYRSRAGQLVQWARARLADDEHGFYNAESGTIVDTSRYVDRNAQMIGAFLRAAAVFDDPWLRDAALRMFDGAILPGYVPGSGVAHAPGVRGLLGDQLAVAEAAIWAHAITGQLPYSMLAAEVTEFALRTMWDERAGAFRDRASPDDPLFPFQLNCEGACVLDRLAALTGTEAYRSRALRILGTLACEYKRYGLFGSPYAVAIREVIDRWPPPGLSLTKVDWGLEAPSEDAG